MPTLPVRHRSRASLVQAAPGLPISTSADPKLGWVERLALNIEYRPLSNLRPYANTARTHTQKQVERIAASIRQFGFVNPILADEKGEIVAGHGRLAAAELLGCEIASKADPGGNGMKLLNI